MQPVENLSRRRLFQGKMAALKPKIRLPWIISEQHFLADCTQCLNCVPVCETQIIKTDERGYPSLDFSKDECTNCGKCQLACKEPLFVEENQKKDNKPWSAEINIKNTCFAQNEIYCQSCQDACDHQAISFQFLTTAIAKPVISSDACTLCGACVSTCPQQSISITPQNEVKHG